MQVSGATREVLELAANEVGVELDMTDLGGVRRPRFRVKVNPGSFKDEYGDRKYQRTSPSGLHDRRVAAVCWHGFRDFFRAVYRMSPKTTFRTGFDTWKDSADFEARYRESGWRNIGSQMYPKAMVEACRCPDSGRAN